MCALREALNWREFGLYQGCQLFSAETHMVYMKARLRALEAFEKLGNWGQVQTPWHGQVSFTLKPCTLRWARSIDSHSVALSV